MKGEERKERNRRRMRWRIRWESWRRKELGKKWSSSSCSSDSNSSASEGRDTRPIFKWHKTGLNSEFSFSYIGYLTKVKERSLSYYLPIAGARKDRFMPFSRV